VCEYRSRNPFNSAIESIFDDKDLSFTDKVNIFKKEWDLEWEKYTPFDECPVRRTTVKISLIPDKNVD